MKSRSTATLLGYVRDARTDESLPGAHVYVMRDGRPEGTVTGVDGSFALEASAGEDVIVSFMGYQTLVFRFDGVGRSISIGLERSATMLDPVEVRPERKKTPWGIIAAGAAFLLLLATGEDKPKRK